MTFLTLSLSFPISISRFDVGRPFWFRHRTNGDCLVLYTVEREKLERERESYDCTTLDDHSFSNILIYIYIQQLRIGRPFLFSHRDNFIF